MFISKDTLPSKHLTNLIKAKIVRQAYDNQQHRISASLWTHENEKIIKGNELSAMAMAFGFSKMVLVWSSGRGGE